MNYVFVPLSGILLFCCNWFFFSNIFFIIYEICKFETIVYISSHVGYCEDAFILSSNYPKNLLLQPSIYGWIHHTTVQISIVLEYFYHHLMSCDGHFPKAHYAYYTNNFIHGQFFSSPRLGLISLNHIFQATWTNIPKLS